MRGEKISQWFCNATASVKLRRHSAKFEAWIQSLIGALKQCLLTGYTDNIFSSKYEPTVFVTHTAYIKNEEGDQVEIAVFDTAGTNLFSLVLIILIHNISSFFSLYITFIRLSRRNELESTHTKHVWRSPLSPLSLPYVQNLCWHESLNHISLF